MSYKPQVDDYVRWAKGVEGWVYFQDKDGKYVTIEVAVRPKNDENYSACNLHRNERLLVLCYHNQWNELECLGYRENKYSETLIQK